MRRRLNHRYHGPKESNQLSTTAEPLTGNYRVRRLLPKCPPSGIAGLLSPGRKGCPPPLADAKCSFSTLKSRTQHMGDCTLVQSGPCARQARPYGAQRRANLPSSRPSPAQEAFKVTADGKVLYTHFPQNATADQADHKAIRQLRGTDVLFKTDGDNIKKYSLPNGCTAIRTGEANE